MRKYGHRIKKTAGAMLATSPDQDHEGISFMATATIDHLAQAIETELNRLRAARPGLSSRISRAENILVTHLSCKRQRVIRVRVAANGKQHFLVNGSHGKVYEVNAKTFSCSCPDANQPGKGCKHSIAVWALSRIGRKPAPALPITRGHRSENLRGIMINPERLAAVAERLGV
jgi:hypothetical protein